MDKLQFFLKSPDEKEPTLLIVIYISRGIRMIDLKELDKKYSVDVLGKAFKLQRNDTEFDIFKGEFKVSEVFDKIKNKEISVAEFDVDGSTGKLEDFITAKLLNDELKVITHNNYVLIFGSLDHFVSKEVIEIPADFTDLFPKYTKETYFFANQVLWLEKENDADKEQIEYVRKMLKNLLKYNTTITVDDLLGND